MPAAVTVKVAAWPRITDWLAGWVMMDAAVAVGLAVELLELAIPEQPAKESVARSAAKNAETWFPRFRRCTRSTPCETCRGRTGRDRGFGHEIGTSASHSARLPIRCVQVRPQLRDLHLTGSTVVDQRVTPAPGPAVETSRIARAPEPP